MKKLAFFFTLSVICFPLISLRPAPEQQNRALKTIIIDPGHGGIDPGTRGLTITESEVALDVSLKLGKAIQKEFPGIKIIYTRTTNVLPGNCTTVNDALRYRAELANQSKGELFISVHCNAAGKKPGGWYESKVVGHKNKVVYKGTGKNRKKTTVRVPVRQSVYVENKAKGTETYIWAADRSDDKSEYIKADDHGEDVEDAGNLLDINSPEARIRQQLYTKYYFRNSYTLAMFVEEEFQKAGRASRGVKQRNNKGIWVLQATGMPSVLVEIGYLSNKEEEQYLKSTTGQEEIVNNLLSAFKRYKKDVEASPK